MSCRTRSSRFEKRNRDSSEPFVLPKRKADAQAGIAIENRVGGCPKGLPPYVRGTSAFRSGRMRRVVAAGRFAPACRRKPAGGGQFSQRPRLYDDFSRQMLLNHGFSAASVSACRLFPAAASANCLFAKTASVRLLHRVCFYTPAFHNGRLCIPVLHRARFCAPAFLPFRRLSVRFGRGG